MDILGPRKSQFLPAASTVVRGQVPARSCCRAALSGPWESRRSSPTALRAWLPHLLHHSPYIDVPGVQSTRRRISGYGNLVFASPLIPAVEMLCNSTTLLATTRRGIGRRDKRVANYVFLRLGSRPSSTSVSRLLFFPNPPASPPLPFLNLLTLPLLLGRQFFSDASPSSRSSFGPCAAPESAAAAPQSYAPPAG